MNQIKPALLVAVAAALCLLGRSTTADARYSHNGEITFLAANGAFENSLRKVTPGQNSGFIAPPDFLVSSYSWSPDGVHIAYVATQANTLWVQNGDPVHIADHVGTTTWSPDGTRVAFTDETGTTLSVSDLTGTNIVPILHASGIKNPAWSPLGDAIVFEAGSALKSVALDGLAVTTLDASHGYKEPTWSPFGDKIAVLSVGKVVIIDPSGVAQPPLAATNGATGFSWSPDETMIAFNQATTGGQAIFTVPVTGGDATQVSTVAHFEGPPAWSPDGSLIAYPRANTGEKADIWMVGSDGSAEQQITDTEVLDDGTVAWQPIPVIVGDGDCGGGVDLNDFIALMHYVAGLAPLSGCQPALNVRCGDALNAEDALAMLKYIADLPPDLPAGCVAIGT